MWAPLCICIGWRVCEAGKPQRCALTPRNIARLLYFTVISVAAKPNLEVESYQAINTNISMLFCARPCRNFPWLNLHAAILFAIICFAPFNFVTRLHCSVVMPVCGCCVATGIHWHAEHQTHWSYFGSSCNRHWDEAESLIRTIPSLRPSPFSSTIIIIIIIIIINVQN